MYPDEKSLERELAEAERRADLVAGELESMLEDLDSLKDTQPVEQLQRAACSAFWSLSLLFP